MPRISEEQRDEARKMYRKGVPMVDIAKKFGVSAETVRTWKRRYEWDKGKPKKNTRNVSKNVSNENETFQPKKPGAQPGNKNAIEGPGNPHPKPHLKHGVYRDPVFEKLSEEEKKLYYAIDCDAELNLINELRLLAIRESWIVEAINKYREQSSDAVFADQTRIDNKRTFANEKEEEQYKKKIAEKIKKGERLPGEVYELQTHTTSKDTTLQRWNQELSTVQSRMEKILSDLLKIRFANEKMQSESTATAVVDDWISAIVGGAVNE